MPELVWKGKGEPERKPHAIVTGELHGGNRRAGWRNRLILGDQAHVLPSLLGDLAGKVNLVYIDPPFDTGGVFSFLASPHGSRERIARLAYRDARGLDAWLAWFHGAAVLLRDLLARDGSLYVHLDAHAAHYAKCVLDEVFGARSFQREIVWRIGWISGFKSRAHNWIRNHDTILFYTKDPARFTFHKDYLPYPRGYVRRDGAPPKGKGRPLCDVWNASDIDRLDSIQIVSFSREKAGYPTQKNESLVSRIVRASSSPGDLVLDCCLGSGTTAVVAEKLGRRWVGADVSPIAIASARRRLLAMPSARPFAVERVASERAEAGGKLRVRARVDGRRATIALAGYAPPAREVRVEHWSQWLDGWCVEWDHRGGAMNVDTRVWRGKTAELPLEASHAYSRSGSSRVALVRAFDVLGGVSTARCALVV